MYPMVTPIAILHSAAHRGARWVNPGPHVEHGGALDQVAGRLGLRPDRLYHHLAQLEEGKLIEIAEYRPLAGGKVERVYAPTAVEPLVGDASPADVARMLNAALETIRADINAASLAEAGEERHQAGDCVRKRRLVRRSRLMVPRPCAYSYNGPSASIGGLGPSRSGVDTRRSQTASRDGGKAL